MTSTYTTSGRTTKQGTNDNPSTWGSKLNAEVFDLLDKQIDGSLVVDVTGSSNITLTTSNGSEDQARYKSLIFTGTLSANISMFIPNVPKVYFLHAKHTGGNVTFKPISASTEVLLTPGSRRIVYTDGTNIYDMVEGVLKASNNLSDIVSAVTARANLGLGTASTLAFDTDGTLAANSDTVLATQKAIKTYSATAAQGVKADTALQPSIRSTPPILRVQQTKPTGIGGGQRDGSMAWKDSNLAGDVILNTTVTSDIPGASHDTGTGIITLPAGKYKIYGWKFVHNCGRCRVRFYNITDSTPLVYSPSGWASGSAGSDRLIFNNDMFTLTGTKTIKFQSLLDGTSGLDNDLGVPTSDGSTEIYGDFIFELIG